MFNVMLARIWFISCSRPITFHHFISYPAEKKGVGPVEVLDRVTVQLFVGDDSAVVAAPVQRDVDGIAQRPH